MPTISDGGLQSEQPRSQLTTAAIAGIAAGVACALLLLASNIVWCVLWRRKRNNATDPGLADAQPGSVAIGHGSGSDSTTGRQSQTFRLLGPLINLKAYLGSSHNAVTTPASGLSEL
jgi:hypothetical protein